MHGSGAAGCLTGRVIVRSGQPRQLRGGGNQDVVGTLRTTVARIKADPTPPAFVLHTGDLTHLSKPEELRLPQMASTRMTDMIPL